MFVALDHVKKSLCVSCSPAIGSGCSFGLSMARGEEFTWNSLGIPGNSSDDEKMFGPDTNSRTQNSRWIPTDYNTQSGNELSLKLLEPLGLVISHTSSMSQPDDECHQLE
jgi:hypothetical protein